MHDAGRLLNPMIAEGQIKGAFVQGLATALYEEFLYDERGGFLTGTFADYLVPTVSETPPLEIMHMESPSPVTPLGAKGLAEGNCMSVPACIANAIADALSVRDVQLPATPKRIHAMIAGPEALPPAGTERAPKPVAAMEGREITGHSSFDVPAPPTDVWRALLSPESLRAVIPGCHRLDVVGSNAYRAEISLGVGAVRGRFVAHVRLSDLDPERSGSLSGTLDGALGTASGQGLVRLSPTPQGTRIEYEYAITVGGKMAAVGGRLLDGATRLLMRQFFERLARHTARRGGSAEREGFLARVRRALFGGGR